MQKKKTILAYFFMALVLISCEEQEEETPIDIDRMVKTEEEQKEDWVVEQFQETTDKDKPDSQEKIANDEEVIKNPEELKIYRK